MEPQWQQPPAPSLPQPPEPPPAPVDMWGAPTASTPQPVVRRAKILRPGELMPGWRIAALATWGGVLLGLMAVWRSSWTVGLSTWWLGPQAAPNNWLIIALPFLAPTAMIVLLSASARYTWMFGLVAAAITAAIAWGDVGRVNGYALAEFVLAGAAALFSLASYGGMARRAE